MSFDLTREIQDISVLKVRDKMDYAELVRLQINRCCMAKTLLGEQPYLFQEHVKTLLSFITKAYRDSDPEFQEDLQKCTETKKVEQPEYWCGVKKRPIKIVEKQVTDYEKVFDVCLDKFNRMGMGAQIKPKHIISIKEPVEENES